MNVLELLALLALLGAGAYLGRALGGPLGMLVGATLGGLAWLALGVLAGRWPPCACGNDALGRFDLAAPAPAPVWRCQLCGRSYQLRGPTWLEVLDDGTRVPRRQRRWYGAWGPIPPR